MRGAAPATLLTSHGIVGVTSATKHGLEEIGHGRRIGAPQMHVVVTIVTHELVLLKFLLELMPPSYSYAYKRLASWDLATPARGQLTA
jgi:hypothetical protein